MYLVKKTMGLREVVFVSVFCIGVVRGNAPKIIDRSGWGARNSSKPLIPLAQNPTPYVILHHSATAPCNDEDKCKQMVKAIQDHHILRKHWDDIGYNFLIGEDGQVYEGRGWGKNGAHTANYNSKSIGICMIGEYESILPKQEALDALRELVALGVSQGQIKDDYKILGHRQVAATRSPGSALYNKMKTWKHWSPTPFSERIISRGEWGARNSKRPLQSFTVNPPPYVIVHHSASPSCVTKENCTATLQSIQNFHMDNREWNDIGYNFLVCEDGNVYEGRGWGKIGAHALKYNSNSIGICMIGHYVSTTPNKAALVALKDLIREGVTKGHIKRDYILLGHGQVGVTECPGGALYNEIKTWKQWSSTL